MPLAARRPRHLIGRARSFGQRQLHTLGFVPLNDLVRQLVCRKTGSAMSTVLVNGRVVFDQGKPVAIDLRELCEESAEIGRQAVADNRGRGVPSTPAGPSTSRDECPRPLIMASAIVRSRRQRNLRHRGIAMIGQRRLVTRTS